MNLLNRVEILEMEAEHFGFCWENAEQIMAQILSECAEIQEHLLPEQASQQRTLLQEEIGDLLHAAFSLCVFCKFNPSVTLQKTLEKFERRLKFVKQLAQEQGLQSLKGHSFDKLMTFWEQAKKLAESSTPMQFECKNESFQLDERLQSSSFKLVDWPLSCVLLKDNVHYPWFILVPRRQDIVEITQLTKEDRYQLMDEMAMLSSIVQGLFKPDKMNLGALGNLVPQLHVHVVGRHHKDPMWPYTMWQSTSPEEKYPEPDSLIMELKHKLSSAFFSIPS